jgi:hypothetical protein
MSSAGPRHRAPSRWCRLEDEVITTVTELLDRNEDLLADYRQRQYRRAHSGRPRRVTVVPRTAVDQRAAC